MPPAARGPFGRRNFSFDSWFSLCDPYLPYPLVPGRQLREETPRVRQAVPRKLGAITTNRLHLELVYQDADIEDAGVIDIIRTPGTFESHIVHELPIAHKPVSYRMWHTIDPLLSSGVIAPMIASLIVLFLLAFTVPKKDNTARLVLDAGPLNDAMAKPPRMRVDTIHTIIWRTLEMKYCITYDAVSFFYQHMINPELWKYFGCMLAAARGLARFFCVLTVLCMGWSYAPAIAQAVARTVIQGLRASAFIDNFAVDERDALDFETRCKRYNIEIRREAEGQDFVYLGIQFQLDQSRFRPSKDTRDALSISLRAYHSRPTARRSMIVVGFLAYTTYVCGIPFACRSKIIEVARNTGKIAAIKGWDCELSWAQDVSEEISRLVAEAAADTWYMRRTPIEETPVDLFSDASDIFMGAVWAIEGEVLAHWSEPLTPTMQQASIYFREGFAAAKSMSFFMAMLRSVQLYVDNQALYLAIKKGHGSPIMNDMVRSVYRGVCF